MTNKTYTKILSPEFTKFNLLTAAIYLTAYELIKSAIINRIRDFFESIEATGETKMLEEYRKEVIALDSSVFVASCKWLQKMQAVSERDIDDILRIREHRHKIAHQLPEFLVDDEVNINTSYLFQMKYLLTKIDTWWIKEVELQANPDFSQESIEDTKVSSGPMLILDHLFSLLLTDKNPKSTA